MHIFNYILNTTLWSTHVFSFWFKQLNLFQNFHITKKKIEFQRFHLTFNSVVLNIQLYALLVADMNNFKYFKLTSNAYLYNFLLNIYL